MTLLCKSKARSRPDFLSFCFGVSENYDKNQPKPHGIAMSRPPLMPTDCSCPRPKLYS